MRCLLALTFLMTAAAAAEPRQDYVDGPWGQIHVRVDGPAAPGAPTVFLIHQMVWSSAQFKYAQPQLAALGVRSIAVDLPGYGLSDGPDHVPDADAYADALLPVLDRYGGARAILFGNHTGVTVIASLADRHPERIARLIIQGPPIFDRITQEKLIAEKPYDQTSRADGGHIVGRWRQAAASFGAKTSLDSQQQSVLQFFQAGPKEWYAHDAVYRYDLAPVLKRLSVPVLILTNPGDSLHSASIEVKTMRPDFELVQIPWPGAHAIYDDPKPWSAAIAAAVMGRP